jgi:hypothetical protein
MASELDELLRGRLADLVDESRRPVEELNDDVQRRVVRRRRVRRMTAGCGVLAALALVLIAPAVFDGAAAPDVSTDADDATGPATSAPPLAPAEPVAVERIDAYGSAAGTERIVVHFDAPVPTVAPPYVDDIEHPDTPGIAITTQRPNGLKLCGNTHSFPGDVGTVDVLIPTAWLEPGTTGSDIPLVNHSNQAKVPACGGPDDIWPLDDYIQIAIWGPASDDAGDVTATISPDGKQLTVETRPPDVVVGEEGDAG